MIDTRGTTLEVGQEVAYNLSGNVVKGRILSLEEKPSKYAAWGGTDKLIRVELLHDLGSTKMGWVSKVKDSKNLLVLNPDEK